MRWLDKVYHMLTFSAPGGLWKTCILAQDRKPPTPAWHTSLGSHVWFVCDGTDRSVCVCICRHTCIWHTVHLIFKLKCVCVDVGGAYVHRYVCACTCALYACMRIHICTGMYACICTYMLCIERGKWHKPYSSQIVLLVRQSVLLSDRHRNQKGLYFPICICI
jgi:hypothetical protein